MTACKKVTSGLSFLVLALLTGLFASVNASVFVKIPLDRLTLLSSHVVTARCTSIESSWDENRTTIYTKAEFDVSNQLRGAELSSSRIGVYLPGGTVGDQSVIVIGAPEIEVDDKLVLMLERIQPGSTQLRLQEGEQVFSVVGLSQGVFDVTKDPTSGEMRAVSQAVPIFLSQGAKAADELPPGGVEGIPLAAFEDSIRSISLREGRTQDAQESEDSAERGEGVERQSDESAEVSEQAAAPAEAAREGQEVEGEEETGAGPGDAPEPAEPAEAEAAAEEAEREREGQEVEGEEERGERPPTTTTIPPNARGQR